MSLIIKICGLSTEDTIGAAVAAGADMVGFVFFAKSPRHVTIERAAALADRARGRAEIVALTVDMDDPGLSAIVDRVRPDWLQLHGAEPPQRVATLQKQLKPRVMKAIGVREAGDLAVARSYLGAADRLLLDARPPKDADRPGGNGAPFDWRLLDGFAPGIPWLLSGGLDPTSVGEAIRATGAPGVDVSSGVESAPGEKDPDLIRAFVAAARKAEHAPRRERMAS